MNAQQRSAFLASYDSVLTSTWSSRRFADQLRADPRRALARCGLAIPDGATARIVDDGNSAAVLADPEAAVGLWEEGWATGIFVVHVPATPHPGRALWTPTLTTASRPAVLAATG